MKKIAKPQFIEFGILLSLVAVGVQLYGGGIVFGRAAALLLLITLIVPAFFMPFAIAWFTLGDYLGHLFSVVFFFLVYVVMVIPISLVRRGMGKDTLMIRKFKSGSGSLFRLRNQRYKAGDLLYPY